MTEVILSNCHRVQNLSINGLIFDVNQIHFFTNTLHCCLCTECSNISSNKTMCFTCHSFWINVLIKFHITSVNAEDFQTSILVWNSNIDFPIKTTETTKSGVNCVGTIGSTNHNNTCTLLKTVHQSQHLTNNSTFHFTIGLFTFWSNRIDFVNENDCWSIFLGFFKSLAQVGLGLSSHFRHDFWTINQEEECSGFIRYSTCDKSFTRPWWTIKQDSTRRLHSKSLE
mmetsp:Transcript_19192/g.28945  ORF Transcript_19192/g.28945 Transcript_19192/m.28945 type:complete len:226 (-) Transcript_19192:819-1496(-)